MPEQVDATIPALYLTGASIPSDYAPVRILGAVKKKQKKNNNFHHIGEGGDPILGGYFNSSTLLGLTS